MLTTRKITKVSRSIERIVSAALRAVRSRADLCRSAERGRAAGSLQKPASVKTMTRLAFDMHPPRIPTVYSSATLEKETSSHASGETVVSASANSAYPAHALRNRQLRSASYRKRGFAFYSTLRKFIREASTNILMSTMRNVQKKYNGKHTSKIYSTTNTLIAFLLNHKLSIYLSSTYFFLLFHIYFFFNRNMFVSIILNSLIVSMQRARSTLVSFFSLFSWRRIFLVTQERYECILFYFLVDVTCFIGTLFVRAWTMIHVETRRQVIHWE